MNESAPQGVPGCTFCAGCALCAICGAAPQAAPSVAVPDGWVLVPKIGTRVKADHPRTVLNPSEYFEVTQVRAESDGNFAVRGEETCWFGLRMLAALPLPAVVQAEPEKPYGYVWFNKHMEHRFTRLKPNGKLYADAMDVKPVYDHPAAPGSSMPAAHQLDTQRATEGMPAPVEPVAERCAQICEAMRPVGGRAWSEGQLAAYEALTAAAERIRAGGLRAIDLHFETKLICREGKQ